MKKQFALKRPLSLILILMLLCSVLVACGDSGSAGTNPDWLAEVSNPFIGEWKSDKAADGTELTFTGKTDGSFEYVMEGLSEGKKNGSGSYLIFDQAILFYFDSGLIQSNQFNVVDNDTIALTAFTLDEMGQPVLGETLNIYRVGKAESTENQPLNLPDSILIGHKWSANIPEGTDPLNISYPAEFEFNRNGTVVISFLGMGEALGFDTEDAPYTFSWLVFDDKIIMLTATEEGGEIKQLQFTQNDDNSLTVNGFTGGVPVTFTMID